jgi:DNA invertase Pin-like site-specific DNA recombinase
MSNVRFNAQRGTSHTMASPQKSADPGPTAPRRFVSYLRVSTDRQGRSGLGLEAQREAVARFVAGIGGQVIAEHVEVESGKDNARPKLAEAMAACRVMRATLLVAKLDRLSRNLAFLANLMEAKTDFVCCDNPHATPFTLHILAAVAEHERSMISTRTKAALAAAKARGVKLGNPNLRAGSSAAVAVARDAHTQQARQRALAVLPFITAAQRAGAVTLREIAAAMEARGIRTPSGRGRWHAATILAVQRIATSSLAETAQPLARVA